MKTLIVSILGTYKLSDYSYGQNSTSYLLLAQRNIWHYIQFLPLEIIVFVD